MVATDFWPHPLVVVVVIVVAAAVVVVSKASQASVSETGFSKKVLEQVREGLRISLQGQKGFDFGDFARWAILKKHVISWLLVAFKLCFFF